MKLQCERCREIVVADFAIAAGGGAIVVTCPACTETYEVAATRGASIVAPGAAPAPVAAAARPVPPDGADAMTCPKCGDVQPPAQACRSCGLLAARMPAFARDHDDAAPELDAAWRDVEERWTDDAAHERLVERAATAARLPWAARRYREALRRRPDDPRAAAQLARIARMAEATLLATGARRDRPSPKPYRGLLALVAALVVLVAVGVGYAILASRTAADEEPRPSTRAKPAAPARPSLVR